MKAKYFNLTNTNYWLIKTRIIPILALILIVFSIYSGCRHEKFDSDLVAINEVKKKVNKFEWKYSVLNTKFSKNEKTMFFLDRQYGWIGDNNTLYRTIDSGKTWVEDNISLRQFETVNKIYFSDLSNGWLAIQKHEKPASSFTDGEFRLLTTNDSGNSWREIFEEKDGSFTSWKFDEQGRIWLAGIKYKTSSPVCYEPLLLNFEIMSDRFIDLTEVIFKNKKRNIVGCLNEAVMGVDVTEDKVVKIITSSGEIYQEKKKSEWHLTNKFNNIFSESSVKVFQSSSSLLWFISSKSGLEGTEGNLTLLRTGGSFDNHTKNGYYFSDAIHISNDEFLISGFKVDSKSNKNFGTVLSTTDGGKSFTEIYQSSNDKEISCMFKSDENSVWALGNNGDLIKLYRTIN